MGYPPGQATAAIVAGTAQLQATRTLFLAEGRSGNVIAHEGSKVDLRACTLLGSGQARNTSLGIGADKRADCELVSGGSCAGASVKLQPAGGAAPV